MSFISPIRTFIKNFDFTSYRSINSIKTAIACLVGLCVAQIPEFQFGQWILISIVVVMSGQTNVGGAVQKAYMRIAGTLCGAVVGAISILLFAHHPVVLYIILILSCLIFAYIAAANKSYNGVGTLGSATVIMILLAKPLSLQVVILRPVEIIVGIIIALVVTRFIVPVHATKRLKNVLAASLHDLKTLYLSSCEKGNVSENHALEVSKKLEEAIIKSFLKQRALFDEAKAEHYKGIKKTILPKIMHSERRVYRAIMLTNYTLHSNEASRKIIQALPSYKNYNEKIIAALKQLQLYLKAKENTFSLPEPLPFAELAAALRDASQRQVFDNAVYIDSFIVALKLLNDEAEELFKVARQLYTQRE